MIQRRFSKDAEDVIRVSRELALQLGYDYISILHFFLADCHLNKSSSIRKFCFKEDAEFNSFLEANKRGPAIIIMENVPLTKDAEIILKQAAVESYLFAAKRIQPSHIFIAAAKVSESFKSIFPDTPNLYERLIQYYTSIGELQNPPTKFRKWLANKTFRKLGVITIKF
ncbi:hypothetical protein [Taibaiella soli]|uniref:Uncharacterized protein n=1 Tax=Taibaiella soli TaxID=1649169 RepID=A0A2W2BGZ7_9BACT|nr:hypothetical protein [Taibaiella soli]PZF72756.1 hypothetical protein DN068_12925 [Taibaiella soli]